MAANGSCPIKEGRCGPPALNGSSAVADLTGGSNTLKTGYADSTGCCNQATVAFAGLVSETVTIFALGDAVGGRVLGRSIC
jgi:hypothetical protein